MPARVTAGNCFYSSNLKVHRLFFGYLIFEGNIAFIRREYNIHNMRKSLTKIKSIMELYELLPANERIITDVLRQIIKENLPPGCKEKISYNVPFFHGNKGICIIWPATVPGGGVRNGVLLGFWYGNKLKDADNYLTHGTNKQIFYKIYHTPEEINSRAIIKLLKEAAKIDGVK